jgi:class 3 adenylate cyclase/predicted ATPase
MSSEDRPALAALLEEQQACWRGGERVLVEDYLARRPALAGDAEAVLDLILHEVLLRRERGEAPELADYQQRFPHLAGPLAVQFEVEGALDLLAPALTALSPVTVRNPPPPSLPGEGEALPERFGRYRVVGRLGAGGMGVVYRAHDDQLRRDVAVKAPHFPGGEAAGDAARLRFLREARAAASVRHPNVCPIYDVGEDAGRPYVVMALVEGESLGDRLRRQGRFEDPREAAALAAAVADALTAVHASGVVHRDVKPGNILLDRAGTPLLSDFGLAHASDGEHLTDPGTLLGTPAYMAPEQAAGDLGAVGAGSDQYSLAVVLYHLLTGRTPFEGSALSVIHQIATQPVPRLSQYRADLDAALERLLMKALARSPQERHASAADFAAALRAWRGQAAGATPPPPAAPAAAARQRRVTLLQCGCDLFDSEALLATLDPEELHELLLAFRQVCRDAGAPLAGTVVKETDDGLLVCFGVPFALECAARRAVRAGLGVLERMASLNESLRRRHEDLRLSARVAVHSDRAVVTSGGRGEGENLSIVGPVAPVVAQLEQLAEPGTLVISDSTHRLVAGFVECSSLGARKLKGTAGASAIYRVEREVAAGSRLGGPRGLVPLIGRDREVALLHERWEQAVEGVGQVVLLVGEAGIGKSRQVLVLKEHVAGQGVSGQPALIVEWPCSPLTQNSSLFPATAWLSAELERGAAGSDSGKLDRLAGDLESLGLAGPEPVALLASLLSLPLEGRWPSLDLSPQRQKEKTFDLLLAWLAALARRQSVLFVIEDLHWADPTTLEFVELLAGQAPVTGLLTLLTCRPEQTPAWRARGSVTQVSLSRLSRRQTGELMLLKSGLPAIPPAVVAQVAARTDGVPLFVEELTAAMLEAGALRVVNGAVEMADTFDAQAIPATLQDLLLARLDRMASNLDVVQLAAVIGREFNYDLVSTAGSCGEEALQRELAKLVDAELLFQHGRPPGAHYQFKHALIRDAAYQSLLKTRRQELHRRLAEVLEERFPETCTDQPQLLAHHFSEGNALAKAVTYFERAGEAAQRRGAAAEVVDHFHRAVELIHALPETPERHAREIPLQISLGVALAAARGYGVADLEGIFARVQALCLQTGLTSQLLPALFGRLRYCLNRAMHAEVQRLAEEMLRLAEREANGAFLVYAHCGLGLTLFFQGKHPEALWHLEWVVMVEATAELRRALRRYILVDPWVSAHAFLSWVHWSLGFPVRAAEHSRQALRTAEQLDHPFSIGLALCDGSFLHLLTQDREAACGAAARALALGREKGFVSLISWARIVEGWAVARTGDSEQALGAIREGLEELHAQAALSDRNVMLPVLAEVCARAGRPEEGLKALADAQQFADSTGEVYWQAEIHRLKGELLLQHDPTQTQDAETCFLQALEVARAQQARSLELRAAVSLGRLWRRQGRPQAAREMVAVVYGTFTEGFQTHDLQEARAFLELADDTL